MCSELSPAAQILALDCRARSRIRPRASRPQTSAKRSRLLIREGARGFIAVYVTRLRSKITVKTKCYRKCAATKEPSTAGATLGKGPAWMKLNGRILYRAEDVLAFERHASPASPRAGGGGRKTQAPPTDSKTRRRPAAATSALAHRHSATPRSRLLDNGYEPLPIVPGEKRPALSAGPRCRSTQAAVEDWTRQFPGHGIGLRTGTLVGVDIDILDPDLAHRDRAAGRGPARRHAGAGRALAEAAAALPDRGAVREDGGRRRRGPRPRPAVRRLRHPPDTGAALLLAARRDAARRAARRAAAGRRGRLRRPARRDRRPAAAGGRASSGPERDAPTARPARRLRPPGTRSAAGRQRPRRRRPRRLALDASPTTPCTTRWPRPAARSRDARRGASGSASRPPPTSTRPAGRWRALRSAGRRAEGRRQARLLAEGRLPPRDDAGGRGRLPGADPLGRRGPRRSSTRCSRPPATGSRHGMPRPKATAPRIGIRATVGLGKSASARRHLLALRERLLAAGAAVAHRGASRRRTPWPRRRPPPGAPRASRVAVLRGYEARRAADAARRCAATSRPSGRRSTRGLERAQDRLRRRRPALRLLRRLPEAAQPRRGRRRRRRRRRPRGALHRLRRQAESIARDPDRRGPLGQRHPRAGRHRRRQLRLRVARPSARAR